jgi:GR25 family glycosyltransferase involved in LPS biosynthesis
MKHVDVWYEMAERKVQLALILEDDAIFVPFFKEKFTRMIYAAIDNRVLRMNETCVKSKEKAISNDERINQNPMIVIGNYLRLHSQSFQLHSSNASPVLTTHKLNPSRCAHAYLLTSCSAQALVDQIQAQKNDLLPPDHLQNHLFRLSPTLQSFWMNPPLAYQGNRVTDLDNIESFKRSTYRK